MSAPVMQQPEQSTALTHAAQLDWVALARASTTYSYEVAARLANEGVEAVAIQAGSAICSSFVFPADGQRELTSSLSHLKGCSSYGKLLWFGFGIKHVVNTLSDTEQGAACVAICAALAVQYSSFDAAKVMRELCLLRGAPYQLIPAVRQWRTLIEACEGSLAKSNFPRYFDGFSRLLASQPWKTREPTNAGIMAKALAMLGDLSRRSLVSVKIAGGVECAWLAAVAQCLLCLRIEIWDEDGRRLYRSSTGSPGPAQAIFQREGTSAPAYPEGHRSLVRQAYFVSSGQELLQEHLDFETSVVRNPTSWSTVLADSFPSAAQLLLNPAYRKQLGFLLRSVAYQGDAYYHSSSPYTSKDIGSIWWLHWRGQGCLFHPRRTGRNLIQFISQVFSELASVIDADNLSSTNSEDVDGLEKCVQRIADACECSSCRKKPTPSSELTSICRTRFSLTIVRLVLILSPVTVHDSLPPSIMALRQLYNHTVAPSPGVSLRTLPCHGLNLVLYLFTGRLTQQQQPSRVAAACGRGVCVFLSILRDPDRPPLEAMAIEVILGQIRHANNTYDYITDISTGIDDDSFLTPSAGTCCANGEGHTIQLIAEEREDVRVIAASYRLVDAQNHAIILNTTFLQEALLSCLRTGYNHPEDTSGSFIVEPETHRWDFSVISDAAFRSLSLEKSYMKSGQEPSWLILTWKAWDKLNSSAPSYQHLEIETYQPCNILLYWLAAQLHGKISHLPYSQRREKVLMAQMIDRPSCIAQLASIAWYNTSKQKYAFAEDTARFDHSKKRGLIRRKKLSDGDETYEVEFELVPMASDKEPTDATRRLRNIFRISKSLF